MPPARRVWRVRNLTLGQELAGAADLARGLWQRARGLLGRRGLARGEGLIIQPCDSVHTLGMRFPLDALYVDGGPEGGKVLRVCRLPPWRVGPWVRGARTVVELPAGAAGATRPGDELRWEEAP